MADEDQKQYAPGARSLVSIEEAAKDREREFSSLLFDSSLGAMELEFKERNVKELEEMKSQMKADYDSQIYAKDREISFKHKELAELTIHSKEFEDLIIQARKEKEMEIEERLRKEKNYEVLLFL